MKKILSILISITLLLSVATFTLTACSSEDSNTTAKTTANITDESTTEENSTEEETSSEETTDEQENKTNTLPNEAEDTSAAE